MSEENRVIVSIDVTELVSFIEDLWWDKDYYEMSLAEKCRWLVEDNIRMHIGTSSLAWGVDDRPFRELRGASMPNKLDYPYWDEHRKLDGHDLIPMCPLPESDAVG